MERYTSKYTGAEIDAGIENANKALNGLGDKLDESRLPEAVNAALAQAKASGEFKGDKGDPGEKGETGAQGPKGDKGDTGNGLTLKAIALLIKILQHATYTVDMSSQIELLAKELMGGGGNTDGGSLIITDDGNGNVTITASGSASITDDGEGNVVITASGGTSITDDGEGNVIIA